MIFESAEALVDHVISEDPGYEVAGWFGPNLEDSPTWDTPGETKAEFLKEAQEYCRNVANKLYDLEQEGFHTNQRIVAYVETFAKMDISPENYSDADLRGTERTLRGVADYCRAIRDA